METEEGTQENQAEEETQETKVESRYETIDIIVRAPEEGDSWFDRLFDLITKDCVERPEDADDDWECPCGLVSMGGSGGTLDQCYDHQRISEKWAFDVEAADLKFFLSLVTSHFALNEEEDEIYQRLHKAAYWHDDFNEWVNSLPDDEDEEEE